MNRLVRLRPLLLLAASAPMLLLVQLSWVDAQTQNGRTQSARLVHREPPPQAPQQTINAWTVGLAGGLLEGAPIRLAAEIARVVDDGDNLHVVPIVMWGHGKREFTTLLTRRGCRYHQFGCA